jgi:hypothetical protein
MSRENVEIVRQFTAPANGVDLVPELREMTQVLGPEFAPRAVLAWWAEDPAWKYLDPDIEWFSDAPLLAETARGAREVALWWKEWVEIWESYVFTTVELRDVGGGWVLNVSDIHARGRQGIDVEMRVFEVAAVSEGKITAYGSGFRSERAALKAAGLAE